MGRPKTSYSEYIAEFLDPDFRLSPEEIRPLPQDRKAWRANVMAAGRGYLLVERETNDTERL